MRYLCWWLILLCCLPCRADIREEISRACGRDPAFYRACVSNLENQYSPGYRAFDLFAYLEKPDRLPLLCAPGNRVETGFPLDLALDGPGFFLLSQGKLCRSAAFRLRQGKLCTSEGPCLLSPQHQPVTLPEDAVDIQFSPRGEVTYVRFNGDGKNEPGGQLGIVQLAHPQWLRPSRGLLVPTAASGPVQVDLGDTRVLARQLELSNSTPLEQQKTCGGVFAFAGFEKTGTSSQARRDLLRLIREHDQRCAAAVENLKRLNTSGFRAKDMIGNRLRTTQGELRETKDPYHLAIDGPGYFLLQNGLLTRDGEFQMDKKGQLVTRDGDCLMGVAGPICVPADMSNLEIKGDGLIFGTRLNGDGKPEELAQIPLARVADDAYLERWGNHLKVTARSGPSRQDLPGRNGCGLIAQGYLEGGNLGAIEQMKMLNALRNYARLLGMPLADDYQP